MFDPFLFSLRGQGLRVGLGEWSAFLRGLRMGLVDDLDGVYQLGRSLLVHSETDYDAYDVAFGVTFEGLEVQPELKQALEAWLMDPKAFDAAREAGEHQFESMEAMWEAFMKTLREQKGRHDQGNRWVGTGGTSPWGNSGRANQGIRVGGSGGGRSAVRVAGARKWRNYRTDQQLGVRDFEVALRALRHLAREGPEALDIDETIRETCNNGGEIELAFRRERANRVRVTLLMDAGGSMDPHTELVERLFTAAKASKTFKTFEHYFFHNCVYGHVYRDFENFDRVPTGDVLAALTPHHRLIFVGDAAMAPWELFSAGGGYGFSGGEGRRSGLEWLQEMNRKCQAAVWLNPDPERFWQHPTVSAIGNTFRMFPLTLEGFRDSLRFLRASR